MSSGSLIPEHGIVKGGRYDGWRYALIRVVDERSEFQVFMDFVVTEPGWPFPTHARLRPWLDFTALVPDASAPSREKAKLLDWDTLLAQAVQVAWDAELATTRRGMPSRFGGDVQAAAPGLNST